MTSELRVRPLMDRHGLEYRLKQAREILAWGEKLQVVCRFDRPESEHPEHGYEVMRLVAEGLSDISRIEVAPRLVRRRMTMLLAPQLDYG